MVRIKLIILFFFLGASAFADDRAEKPNITECVSTTRAMGKAVKKRKAAPLSMRDFKDLDSLPGFMDIWAQNSSSPKENGTNSDQKFVYPEGDIIQYRAELKKYPVLTESQQKLAFQYLKKLNVGLENSGDLSPQDPFVRLRDTLKNYIITRNLRLAYYAATRATYSFDEVLDLIQIANLRLLRIVDQYDPDQNNTFSTYAVRSLWRAIKDQRLFLGRAANPGKKQKQTYFKIKAWIARQKNELGTIPTTKEIAEHFRIKEESVAHLLASFNVGWSIDAVDPGKAIYRRVENREVSSDQFEISGKKITRADLIELVQRLLPQLNQKDGAAVLQLKFGVSSSPVKGTKRKITSTLVGELLNQDSPYTRQWVDKLKDAAMLELRWRIFLELNEGLSEVETSMINQLYISKTGTDQDTLTRIASEFHLDTSETKNIHDALLEKFQKFKISF